MFISNMITKLRGFAPLRSVNSWTVSRVVGAALGLGMMAVAGHAQQADNEVAAGEVVFVAGSANQ